MNSRQTDEKRIEELLRQIREQEAPVWLKQKIMQRVYSCRPGLCHRLTSWRFRLPALRFLPRGMVLACVLVCMAFWSGILAGRYTAGLEKRTATSVAALGDDAGANYLLGRGLLAGNQREAALGFFRKAVQLDPGSAEYLHWQGVAYWTMGEEDLERQSYFQTMKDHPDYLPSLLNLGHSYLEGGNYQTALHYYQRVLQHDPKDPEALYNSALAYRKLDDKVKERQALGQYLEANRSGRWAHRAVDHLHQLGDSTFRSYRIGMQRIVLNVTELLQTGSSGQQKEVEFLARAVRQTARQELHIVVYDRGKKETARMAALGLRNRLLDQLGREDDHPIKISWFDTEERVTSAVGEKLELSPSVLIFSNPLDGENRRKSI